MWNELKLPVIPSVYLLEEHIVRQMKYLDGRLVDKTEDHIERNHEDGKHLSRRS